MAKFKVGDKVKIVGPSFSGLGHRRNEIVEINVESSPGVWSILPFKGSGNCYRESSLEPAPRFAAGDEVRVKAGSPVYGEVCGDATLSPPFARSFGSKLKIASKNNNGTECARNTLGHWNCVPTDGNPDWITGDYLEPWNPAEEWDGSKWVAKKVSFFPEYLKEICSPYTKAHIVINRHASGQLKPAATPYVHEHYDDAKIEAHRLADAHKGEEFCVFGLKDVVKVEKSPAEKYAGQWEERQRETPLPGMEFVKATATTDGYLNVVYREIKGA